VKSEEGFAQSEFYQDVLLEQAVEKLSSCCPKGTRFGFGCLLSLFRPDREILLQLLQPGDRIKYSRLRG